jgi:pSer/pThr/pTyr-binding forkhead associated (FHA) protein
LAQLKVLNGSRAGTVFALPEVPTVIGRSPEAHLQVLDPWISSMHAMFERRGAELWVVDLESRNGTFVGEERVNEAPVRPGMAIRFGRTEVQLAEGLPMKPSLSPPPEGQARHDMRGRRGPHRATIRSDATAGTGLPRVREPEDDSPPLAIEARSAAVLRLALHAGQGAPPAAAVRAALDAATRVALNEGGLVARTAGSGVLALFGFTGASPDDAVRALRAARAARAAVREGGDGLDLRAAVDRGPVLAGNIGGPDAFELAALGETAERAERLLALARPGEILAGPGAAGAEGLGPGELRRLGSDEVEVFSDQGG